MPRLVPHRAFPSPRRDGCVPRCIAGATPTWRSVVSVAMPKAMREDPRVDPDFVDRAATATGQTRTGTMPGASIDASPLTSATRPRRPRRQPPAEAARTAHSASTCRTTRPRLAPRATRTASSRCRAGRADQNAGLRHSRRRSTGRARHGSQEDAQRRRRSVGRAALSAAAARSAAHRSGGASARRGGTERPIEIGFLDWRPIASPAGARRADHLGWSSGCKWHPADTGGSTPRERRLETRSRRQHANDGDRRAAAAVRSLASPTARSDDRRIARNRRRHASSLRTTTSGSRSSLASIRRPRAGRTPRSREQIRRHHRARQSRRAVIGANTAPRPR